MWPSRFRIHSRGKCISICDGLKKLPAWGGKWLEEPVSSGSSGIKTSWILVNWFFITAASVVTSPFLSWEQQWYVLIWGSASPSSLRAGVSASADAKQVACGYQLRGLGHGLFKDLETWKLFTKCSVCVSHFQERGSVFKMSLEPLL